MSQCATLRSDALLLRLWGPADHPTIFGWWRGHGATPPVVEILPELGVIVESVAGPIAGCWSYMDRSRSVAMICYPVTAPGLPGGLAWRALSLAIEFLEEHLKAEGYTHVLAFVSRESLSRLLDRRGYQGTMTEHYQRVKPLWPQA